MLHAIKPGRMPEPLEPVSTRDPQSAIDRCLSCTVTECFGQCSPYEQARERKGTGGDGRSYKELDEKVKAMIDAGYNDYPICRALGITENDLRKAKERLRYHRRKENK